MSRPKKRRHGPYKWELIWSELCVRLCWCVSLIKTAIHKVFKRVPRKKIKQRAPKSASHFCLSRLSYIAEYTLSWNFHTLNTNTLKSKSRQMSSLPWDRTVSRNESISKGNQFIGSIPKLCQQWQFFCWLTVIQAHSISLTISPYVKYIFRIVIWW